MAYAVKWDSLGLTRQQADIMQTALMLASGKAKCTPVEIQRAYEKAAGQTVQKPNFFAQLKTLTGMSFLLKQGTEYVPNPPAIERALEARKRQLKEEAAKLEMQARDFKKLAESAGLQSFAPLVQYQSLESYFGHLAEHLDDECEVFCSNSVFPWVVFSTPIAAVSGSAEYYSRVRALCGRKDTDVRYITGLNARYLVDLALRTTRGDRKAALRECLKTLENMRSMLRLFPNLHIRHIPGAMNFHFVVNKPRGGEPHCLYLFIFGKTGDIQNGVVINSSGMAADMFKMFNEEFDRALDMRSPKAANVYKMLEKQFRAILAGKRTV
jgi:hypothetical protein